MTNSWMVVLLTLPMGVCVAWGQGTTPTTAPQGLDSLTDDRLIGELARRGLSDLLERAFEQQHIPTQQREGMRALIALRALGDPDSKLTATQRRQLIDRVAAGIDQALVSLDDAPTLMQQATALLKYGVERD